MTVYKSTSFLFFDKPLFQGNASLDEVVEKFESDTPVFHRNMWFKSPQYLYWAKLEYQPEIAKALHWDYLQDKVLHTKIKGAVLIDLFNQGLIKKNTQVKLAHGSRWSKFQDTILFENSNKKFFTCKISSRRPDWRNSLADMIDFFCHYALTILFAMFLIDLSIIVPEVSYLLLFPTYFLFTVFPYILPSFFDAIWISLWGRTIGYKIVGLYILNSQGEKLTFSKAFERQSKLIEFAIRLRRNENREELHYFGAARWDRENGCVITEQCL